MNLVRPFLSSDFFVSAEENIWINKIELGKLNNMSVHRHFSDDNFTEIT